VDAAGTVTPYALPHCLVTTVGKGANSGYADVFKQSGSPERSRGRGDLEAQVTQPTHQPGKHGNASSTSAIGASTLPLPAQEATASLAHSVSKPRGKDIRNRRFGGLVVLGFAGSIRNGTPCDDAVRPQERSCPPGHASSQRGGSNPAAALNQRIDASDKSPRQSSAMSAQRFVCS
jgi:hypothetical protein